MMHYIMAPGVVINVEHISSLIMQPSGLTEVTLLNGKVFTFDKAIQEILEAIAEAYRQ